MGIWRNIGKIVVLSFEIIYHEIAWYISSWNRVKRISPKKKVNNIYLNEKDESLERSNLIVELCEQPYYDTKHEPE